MRQLTTRTNNDAYSEELERMGRTFEQIVEQDFNGNIKECCRAIGCEKHIITIYQILNGTLPLNYASKLIRKISIEFDGDRDILFPPNMYRASLFTSVAETPGFQKIKHKWKLSYHTQGKSLSSLLKEKGFRRSDYHRLIPIFLGVTSYKNNYHFCERVATALEIPVADLFPVAIYEQLTEDSPQKRIKKISIEEPSHQRVLLEAEDPASTISIHILRESIVGRLMKTLSPEHCEVIERRYGFRGEPETLEAMEDDTITHQGISLREHAALEKMRHLLLRTDIAEDLRELSRLERRENRVRI